jgi:hypothetical protein
VDASPGPGDLIAIVDVDYYINMPELLSSNYSPVLMYTFIPDDICAVRKEYSYTFRDGQIEYLVSGGGKYNHRIWDYGCDSILVDYNNTLTTYLVDKKRVADDHYLVLLTPTARWKAKWYSHPLAYRLARRDLDGQRLRYLNPCLGDGLCVMDIRSEANHSVSISIEGSFSAATVPRITFDAMIATSRTLKRGIELAQSESFIPADADHSKEQRKLIAAYLTLYGRRELQDKHFTVFPVEEGIKRYQYGVYEPDAKPSLVAYMRPIVDGAFAPDKTIGNERRMIEKRITNLAKEPADITPFMLTVIREFVERLIPTPHLLSPASIETVFDNQPRPSQQSILRRAMGNGPYVKNVVQSFMKAECYAKPSDPRPISTMQGNEKVDYSSVIYPLADHIKKFAWYAFGRTPRSIAERVASICGRSKSVSNTDFSRFDGHKDNTARLLEESILRRAFHPTYHSFVLDAHLRSYGLQAYSAFGIKYDTKFAQNSGSPDTSLFNTVLNAFIAYLAKRMEKDENGVFKSPNVAWNEVNETCIFGGDDGLAGDPPTTYEKAASLLNHDLKIEIIPRDECGVSFLARRYGPQVWYGDINSCCDIKRQLSKFHATTPRPGVPDARILLEKSHSYWLTDANTPWIGELVSAIEKCDFARGITRSPVRWTDQFDRSDQYPNEEATWMYGYAIESLPNFNERLFLKYLECCKTVDHFLSFPTCCTIDVTSEDDVVVNGITYGPRH